jgi:hypothetical protein
LWLSFSFAGKHRIDWDILETVRYSKKGKLIIDLDLLNDIDVCGYLLKFIQNIDC